MCVYKCVCVYTHPLNSLHISTCTYTHLIPVVCVCVCVYACTYTEWSLAGWTPLSSVCSAEWKLVREGRCLPSYFTHFFIIWFVANTVPVCEQAVLAVCKNILPLWSITCIFTFFNYWGKLGRLHLVSRSVLCGGNEELLFF